MIALLFLILLVWGSREASSAASYTLLYSGGTTTGAIGTGTRSSAAAICMASPYAAGCMVVTPFLVFNGESTASAHSPVGGVIAAIQAAGINVTQPVYDTSDRLIATMLDSDILDAYMYATFPGGAWYGAGMDGMADEGVPNCAGWTTASSCTYGMATFLQPYGRNRPCSETLTLPCLCGGASTLAPTTPTALKPTFSPTIPYPSAAPTTSTPSANPSKAPTSSTPTVSPVTKSPTVAG